MSFPQNKELPKLRKLQKTLPFKSDEYEILGKWERDGEKGANSFPITTWLRGRVNRLWHFTEILLNNGPNISIP
jgi:hypothetical protein